MGIYHRVSDHGLESGLEADTDPPAIQKIYAGAEIRKQAEFRRWPTDEAESYGRERIY